MGFLFGGGQKQQEQAKSVIPGPDVDETRIAGQAERERRMRRRGAAATMLETYGSKTGGASGYSEVTGGAS